MTSACESTKDRASTQPVSRGRNPLRIRPMPSIVSPIVLSSSGWQRDSEEHQVQVGDPVGEEQRQPPSGSTTCSVSRQPHRSENAGPRAARSEPRARRRARRAGQARRTCRRSRRRCPGRPQSTRGPRVCMAGSAHQWASGLSKSLRPSSVRIRARAFNGAIARLSAANRHDGEAGAACEGVVHGKLLTLELDALNARTAALRGNRPRGHTSSTLGMTSEAPGSVAWNVPRRNPLGLTRTDCCCQRRWSWRAASKCWWPT